MDVSSSSESRLGQWSMEEAKEMVGIRAELDQNFMEMKRNKQLWELISNAMNHKGYHRSAQQCKCKWKNLVTRYKGCETGEAESTKVQQFPLYNEVEAIFTGRMQRLVWAEAEGGGGWWTRKKKAAVSYSSEEEDEKKVDEDHHDMSIEGDENDKSRRKKMKKGKMSMNSNNGGLKEIVEELMRQQMQIESEWMEAFEAREKERKEKERKWRETMEALEKERMMMDQRWREKEEQRRVREEARAHTTDALITALLNKLSTQDMMMIIKQ